MIAETTSFADDIGHAVSTAGVGGARGRASQDFFFGVSALFFAAGAAKTIVSCGSMSGMGEIAMPGGWTISMAWMRMPGDSWLGAAASFLGMWVVMMVPMMLPSLMPMLWRYRQAVGWTSQTRLDCLTAVAGLGYFFVWTLLGMAVFPLGVALAAVEMRNAALSHAVPVAIGAILVIAGLIQFTAWKAHRLACCRDALGHGRILPEDSGVAWKHGLRLGFHCSSCCANLMAVLLALGMMDVRAMSAVTITMALERLAPASKSVARAIGAVVVGAGLILIVRAVGRA